MMLVTGDGISEPQKIDYLRGFSGWFHLALWCPKPTPQATTNLPNTPQHPRSAQNFISQHFPT